jgi:hypothetical protein
MSLKRRGSRRHARAQREAMADAIEAAVPPSEGLVMGSASDDFVPPPPSSDMEMVETPWGRMEVWRARAMGIGQTSNAVAHADDTTPTETKPPVPVGQASVEEGERDDAADPRLADACSLMSQLIERLSAKIDELQALRARNEALEAQIAGSAGTDADVAAPLPN